MLLGVALAVVGLSTPLAAQRVQSLVGTVPRSDDSLGSAVKSLLAEAPAPEPLVDFANRAGTWRVVHAPHIDLGGCRNGFEAVAC